MLEWRLGCSGRSKSLLLFVGICLATERSYLACFLQSSLKSNLFFILAQVVDLALFASRPILRHTDSNQAMAKSMVHMNDANRAMCYALRHPPRGEKATRLKDIRKIVRKVDGQRPTESAIAKAASTYKDEKGDHIKFRELLILDLSLGGFRLPPCLPSSSARHSFCGFLKFDPGIPVCSIQIPRNVCLGGRLWGGSPPLSQGMGKS